MPRSTTQPSISEIRPKRSAVGRNAPGGIDRPVGPEHPHEHLAANPLAAGELEDRLRVQAEAVVVDRIAHLADPGEPLGPAALEDLVAVAAALLRLVQGDVGGDDQLLIGRAGVPVEQHGPGAGPRRQPRLELAHRAQQRREPSRTSSAVAPSRRSPNSSPPKRARNSLGPSASVSVVVEVRSSESPAAWPSESLMYLRSSTSRSATAPAPPRSPAP